MKKNLSIIIPTYNMELLLRKCLDSLILPKKLMREVEVLVINDGSKDSSSAIAHEYEKNYPQTFRVIDKENGNYGSCINRGVKEASGKYVKILDADDTFFPEAYKVYVESLQSRNEDLIITDYAMVDIEGCVTRYERCDKVVPNKPFSMSGFCEHLQMHNITYKLENLRRIGYQQTEGISYTDREWAFWPMIAVKKIYYMPICLYSYLVGREGQTMDEKIYLKSADQEVLITKKMVDLWTCHKDNFGMAADYLNNTLCGRFKFLIWGDISEHKGTNQDKYIEMDKYLKVNYPDFYEYSSRHTILARRYPYHFLKDWRNGYRLSRFNPYIIVFKILGKLFL